MTIKELIKQAQQGQGVAKTVRLYADISGEVNSKLEMLAGMANKTKKGMLEWLILEAVREFESKDKETSKRAKGKK